MRLHRRRLRDLLLVAVLAVATAIASAAAGLGTEPTISAAGGGYGSYYWNPSTAEVNEGGTVAFQNTSASIPHGVVWTSGPETPSCPGVPVNEGKTSWKGTCTFTHAGTYNFHCYVHPTEMTGTITVAAAGAPILSSGPATGVSEREATLNGAVNPEGKATTYFFNYGTTAAYGTKTSVQSAGEGMTSKAVSAMVSGLSPATTYHFQLVATNSSGTTSGPDETFTTASPPPTPGPPTATTGEAGSLSETEATLNGTVDPDGETTMYFFEYGTSTAYGQRSSESVLPATDHSGHAVSATLTGLASGTRYHYRLIAESNKGTAQGSDGEFTTTSPPPPKEPPPSPSPPGTTATALTTPPPASMLPKSEEPTRAGPPLVASSLKLSVPHHGSSVHGSLEVSRAGAGGRLEVDLLSGNASLAKARRAHSVKARRAPRPKQVTVGRLVRRSVRAGRLSFSVSLNARGKRALRRHHRLALVVRITLTPPHGKAGQVTRAIVLRT